MQTTPDSPLRVQINGAVFAARGGRFAPEVPGEGVPFAELKRRTHPGVSVSATQTVRLKTNASEVWSMITQSFMALPAPTLTRLGIPRPITAYFPISGGGLGQLRVCRLKPGTLWQRVLAWQPRHLLHLEMVSGEDLPRDLLACDERYEMFIDDAGWTVVRWTVTLRVRRRAALRAPLYYAAARLLQRYTIRNWRVMLVTDDWLPW